MESDNLLTENLQSQPTPQMPVKPLVKRRPGRPKGSGTIENLTPFTSERARAVAAKAAEARKARHEVRRRLLAAAIEGGLEEQFIKALKLGDAELMSVVAQASKLTGTDFASSDEAVQQVKVNAETNSKVKADTTLHVTIEEATK